MKAIESAVPISGDGPVGLTLPTKLTLYEVESLCAESEPVTILASKPCGVGG